MEEIRAASCDAQVRDLETGGVLFGKRTGTSIRILNWRPIACEYAEGPGFRLSPRDRMEAACLIELASRDEALKALEPVGWFVSHLQGGIWLRPSDLEIYDNFFPGAEQIALVLRPDQSGCMGAGFFVRPAEGDLMPDLSSREFAVEPLWLPSVIQEPPTPAPDPVGQAANGADVATAPDTWRGMEKPPEESRFRVLLRVKSSSGLHWLWAMPAFVALAAIALLLWPTPEPVGSKSFSLRAAGEGNIITIFWDGNAAPIQKANRATIDVHDGPNISQIALSASQLHDGRVSYPRRTGDVAFDMTVYPAKGPALHEFAHFVVQQVLVTAPTPPQEPEQWRAERDELQGEIQDLKKELHVQSTRADRLMEVVRALENRLGIETGGDKKQDK
jgi:hypothetical protein